MGIRSLTDLEREMDSCYTENLTINMDSSNPYMKDILLMVENRDLSVSLRRQMRIN